MLSREAEIAAACEHILVTAINQIKEMLAVAAKTPGPLPKSVDKLTSSKVMSYAELRQDDAERQLLASHYELHREEFLKIGCSFAEVQSAYSYCKEQDPTLTPAAYLGLPRGAAVLVPSFTAFSEDTEVAKVARHYETYSEEYRKYGTTKADLVSGYRNNLKVDPGVTAAQFLGADKYAREACARCNATEGCTCDYSKLRVTVSR